MTHENVLLMVVIIMFVLCTVCLWYSQHFYLVLLFGLFVIGFLPFCFYRYNIKLYIYTPIILIYVFSLLYQKYPQVKFVCWFLSVIQVIICWYIYKKHQRQKFERQKQQRQKLDKQTLKEIRQGERTIMNMMKNISSMCNVISRKSLTGELNLFRSQGYLKDFMENVKNCDEKHKQQLNKRLEELSTYAPNFLQLYKKNPERNTKMFIGNRLKFYQNLVKQLNQHNKNF